MLDEDTAWRQLGSYVMFDDKGRILQTLQTSHETAEALYRQHFRILQAEADPQVHYILDGKVTDRPANPAVLVGSKIVNVPNPTRILFHGEFFTCEDGEIDVRSPTSETITLQSFPYLDKEFEIEADPQA